MCPSLVKSAFNEIPPMYYVLIGIPMKLIFG